MIPDDPRLAPLFRKLERLSPIGSEDREALSRLPYRFEDVAPGRLLVREGDAPTECCVLLRGFVCRHKATSGGARQIVSFHLPGDILDLQHLKLPRADHSVEATTRAEVAWIPMEALNRLLRSHPALADALWRDALIDASIFREWVLNVGRRDARSRVAHMLCEFAARREAAGLGSPERFELPMTQEQIADATGMTIVHVNRTLKALTDEGAISRDGREVRISDWAQMQRIADFNPAYLHNAA
jgi:CRP-like cAMP-binding protein